MLRIKEIIKEKGTSVQEVAKKMGIQPPSLSRAINGNTTVEMLEKIADAIGCEVSDFFERKEPNNFKCPNCGYDLNVKIE